MRHGADVCNGSSVGGQQSRHRGEELDGHGTELQRLTKEARSGTGGRGEGRFELDEGMRSSRASSWYEGVRLLKGRGWGGDDRGGERLAVSDLFTVVEW